MNLANHSRFLGGQCIIPKSPMAAVGVLAIRRTELEVLENNMIEWSSLAPVVEVFLRCRIVEKPLRVLSPRCTILVAALKCFRNKRIHVLTTSMYGTLRISELELLSEIASNSRQNYKSEKHIPRLEAASCLAS